MSNPSDLLTALRPVLTELNRLNVRHYVGGSVASSFHGAARSTLDADVVAELDEATALRLIEPLKGQYYVSEKAVREAVHHRSCFNLIHLATSFKIDVFVSKGRSFDRAALQRADLDRLSESDSMLTRIASAEDIILIKLEWYRLGGEISERQWSDVSRVARLQRKSLDLDYMRQSAKELGVSDLVDRLLVEVEIAGGEV